MRGPPQSPPAGAALNEFGQGNAWDFETQILLARNAVLGMPKGQRLVRASEARRLAISHRYEATQKGNGANAAGLIGVGFGGGLVATAVAVALTGPITLPIIAVGTAGVGLLAIGGIAAHMLNSSRAENERKALLLDYFAEEVSR